jgi:quercetin dioxygenase-like cupin family protein
VTIMKQKNLTLPCESIIRATTQSSNELAPGASLRMLASGACGARGLCTALATFAPGAELPYHIHDYSEAVTVLSGSASVVVEGRTYLLSRLDCIHVPKALPHATVNASSSKLTLLVAFANSEPDRQLVDGKEYCRILRGLNNPEPSDPEHIRRFAQTEKYELAPGTQFCDLFAGRFGAVGICGGYGEFAPGNSLPCHVHDFGESITIITGQARCETMGRSYHLSGCDTAFIPQHRPHRFLNESQKLMAMIWVYAGDEPTRELVETGYCTGVLAWPDNESENGGAG